MVKQLIGLLMALGISASILAQTPLSADEALAQIYKDYDPARHEAKWVCSAAQEMTDPAKRDGWPCEQEVVRVSLLLLSQLQEGNEWKTYVVATASPGEDPKAYECHACALAVGVAVFQWSHTAWKLQTGNAAVGFYGEWGGGPDAELVAIGPRKNGVILWTTYGGQGYHRSIRHLIASVENQLDEIWTLIDETDDSGAYDPTDKLAPHRRYYAEVAFKFVYTGNDDFYDIIAMSRGTDSKGTANWTEQYRFRDGGYRLLKRTVYTESGRAKAGIESRAGAR